jgi:hypothetical protein
VKAEGRYRVAIFLKAIWMKILLMMSRDADGTDRKTG